MKRPLAIVTTTILIILFMYACGSTIRTANTSFVTITIGGSQVTAVLKAEVATPWTRLKHYLADVKWVSEAYAYIPSIVQVLTVTVTAPDIATPIIGVSSVSSTQTTATLKIEVPNGTDRHFLVEGLRALPSGVTQTVFSGTNRSDLTGADVNLQINMNFVGTGIYVNPSRLLTANTPTCGSSVANACATITHVLTSRPATTNYDIIVAMSGSYNVGAGAPYETFPLSLKPGMALLCIGTGFSSVIDASTFGTMAIRGNDNASVDNCMIKVGQGGTGINDMSNPQLLITAATRINGSLFQVPTGATGPSVGIVLANDKSVLLDSSVTGTNASFQAIGVQVNGGKPSIISNTITNLPTGIDLTSGSGNALITGSTISGNSTGINVATTAKPTISNMIFDGNGRGVIVAGGSPQITGSTFINNTNAGLDIVSGSPLITQNVITKNFDGILGGTGTTVIQNNSIYCNTFFNLSTSITATMDVRFNAWEHAPPQVNGVASGTNCLQGDDICANGSAIPDYSAYTAAVPGTCNRILGKPQ